MTFSEIWEQYIVPLQGKTLKMHRVGTNKIIRVDSNGIQRVSKNNKISTVSIELFAWTVAELFARGEITRVDIHDNNQTARASSFVFLVLSQVPLFRVEYDPEKLFYKK
jgi:restriction system protein